MGTTWRRRASPPEVRRQVGLVFQYPENQLFANTVYDDVAFGPRNMGLGAEEVDRRVREGLALVGLSFDELSERSPFDLSGGQQRRVAFAGVLAMEPEVLVLDEPVAGLRHRSPARSSWGSSASCTPAAAPSSWCLTPWRTWRR